MNKWEKLKIIERNKTEYTKAIIVVIQTEKKHHCSTMEWNTHTKNIDKWKALIILTVRQYEILLFVNGKGSTDKEVN